MARKAKEVKIDAAYVLKLRTEAGLNQSEFWKKLGVTQSGGSRYESGRNIPKPLRLLITIIHAKAMLSPEQVATL